VAHLPPKIKIFNSVVEETLQHLERRMVFKASQEQEVLLKIKIKMVCNLEEEHNKHQQLEVAQKKE